MFGFVTAITAADAAAKAADVKVIAIDSNKPANADSVEVPLIMASRACWQQQRYCVIDTRHGGKHIRTYK